VTPLLLPPQEMNIDNFLKNKKKWKCPKNQGPYKSMKLENPRKN